MHHALGLGWLHAFGCTIVTPAVTIVTALVTIVTGVVTILRLAAPAFASHPLPSARCMCDVASSIDASILFSASCVHI